MSEQTPTAPIPYGRQLIEDADIEAVVEVLRGDWLTTGPTVDAFEGALAEAGGAMQAVAIANGTAALHAAYEAAGVGPGDEVIVPSLTFSATANAARYLGATVRFADVDETLTMDPEHAASLVNERTKVIAPVDFAGHPADIDRIREVAAKVDAVVVEDAAHSLGAAYKGRPVGSLADMTTFSFHPVKLITTAEGGAILTDDAAYVARLRSFRSHGMRRGEVAGDPEAGGWAYDIDEIGYNYRLSDLQCALGLSQISRLGAWIARRQDIAAMYRKLLADLPEIELPPQAEWCTSHAHHLFAIRVPAERRRAIFDALREQGILVQVHYIPVNMLEAYQQAGYSPDETPRTLEAYQRMISIPCFPSMTDGDVERVAQTIRRVMAGG